MALISIKRNVDLQPGLNAPAVFNCSQSDKGTTIMLGLMNGGNDYTVPSGVTITIRGSRSNGAVFTPVSATFSGSTVSFTLTEEMTDTAGPTLCEAVLEQGNNVLGTANFIINVEGSPMGADVPPVFTDAAWDWMLGKFNSEIIPEFNASLIDAIDSKLDKVFPTDLSGKYLKINSTGHVEPSDIEEIPVDATLSHEGEAADAKATGDALALKANKSTIAPEFSKSTAYTVGQYVYKNGVLYRFTATHSGAWTGTDAETVTVSQTLTDVNKYAVGKNLVGSVPFVLYPVNLKSGTKITMSTSDGNAIDTETYLCMFNSNRVRVDYTRFYNANASRTYTLANDISYILWATKYTGKLQLEVGDTATSYEEYFKNTKNLESDVFQNQKDIINGCVEEFPYAGQRFYNNGISPAPDGTYLTTRYFNVKVGDKIDIDTGTLKHKVAIWKTTTTSSSNVIRLDSNWITENESFEILNDGLCAVSFAKSDNSSILFSDYDGHVIWHNSLASRNTSAINGIDAKVLKSVYGAEYSLCVLANGSVANSSNTGAVCTEEYIPVNPGDTVAIFVNKPLKASGNYYAYGYRTYDSNKSVVNSADYSSSTTGYNIVTIPTGCAYIRFTIAEYNSSSTAVTIRKTDFAYNDVVFSPDYSETLDYIRNNLGVSNPPVYSDDDVSAKCTEFSNLLQSITKAESFMFVTDPHLMSNNNSFDTAAINKFNLYMDVMKKYYSCLPLEFILDGGDWLNSGDYKVSAMEKLGYVDAAYKRVFGESVRRPLVGNHDNNEQGYEDAEDTSTGSGLLNNNQLRFAWFSNYPNCYYSFKGMYTTFYCMDSGTDKSITMTPYRWEQIDWLAKSLESETSLHIVIPIHIYYNTSISSAVTAKLAENIVAVAVAYNARTTITLNGETYDFTDAVGKVACILTGHTHEDANTTVNGIPVIFTKNAGALGNGGPTFDICLIDYDTAKINMVRVGSGSSRSISIVT